ncbi:uncharacterized protein LOC144128137 [Amblyomma americanum]
MGGRLKRWLRDAVWPDLLGYNPTICGGVLEDFSAAEYHGGTLRTEELAPRPQTSSYGGCTRDDVNRADDANRASTEAFETPLLDDIYCRRSDATEDGTDETEVVEGNWADLDESRPQRLEWQPSHHHQRDERRRSGLADWEQVPIGRGSRCLFIRPAPTKRLVRRGSCCRPVLRIAGRAASGTPSFAGRVRAAAEGLQAAGGCRLLRDPAGTELQAQDFGHRYTVRGYDSFVDCRRLTFLDPLPKARVCCLCHDVLPVQYLAPCGNAVCASCLDVSIKEAPAKCRERREGTSPEGHAKFSMRGVTRLDFNAKDLGTLRVYCPNIWYGCTQSSELRHLEEHYLKNCPHHPKMCFHCRREDIPPGDFVPHIYSCKRRQEEARSVDRQSPPVQQSLSESPASQTEDEHLCATQALLAEVTERGGEVHPEPVEHLNQLAADIKRAP